MIGAQLIHAAGESSPGNLPPTTHAVALAAVDEAQLLDLEQRLIAHGIKHYAIREPDPPYNGELMAIGLPPMDRKSLPKFMARLQLLK